MNKKAQAGTAAGVVAIVAFIIILYILLLPEDVRNQLFNTTAAPTTAQRAQVAAERNILVFEHPGTMDPVKLRSREKVLDSFNLYAEKTATVLKSVQTVHIENGWLRKEVYNLSFSVADLANTENYVLAFDVTNAQGRLLASLNGKQIYDSTVSVGNVEPIKLERDQIQSENSLLFTVSGVGLAFWRLNEYDLRNVRVIADFTDVSKREYKNFFIITATEKENFEKTKLTFVPDCLTQKVGPLKILINDRELHYQTIPDCGLLSSIEFDQNYLKQGENTITFRADEGSYFIDRVSIKADLKVLQYPFYYFELKRADFGKITNNTANVTLELQFADKEDKIGELNVNGHLSRLETSNVTFTKDLNVFVDEGQNYLQIVPKTVLNIVDLKVTLEK